MTKKCYKCDDRGIIEYYHDAGDHFGAGRAPGSEYRWTACDICFPKGVTCLWLNDKVMKGFFRDKPGCDCENIIVDNCQRIHDRHNHFGDCQYFKPITL